MGSSPTDRERLGDQPDFEAWAEEVVAAVTTRRRDAEAVEEAKETEECDAVAVRTPKRPKRRWRFLFGCLP